MVAGGEVWRYIGKFLPVCRNCVCTSRMDSFFNPLPLFIGVLGGGGRLGRGYNSDFLGHQEKFVQSQFLRMFSGFL